MIKILIIICWLCAIANVVIVILNVLITYKRHKAFIEFEEKMKLFADKLKEQEHDCGKSEEEKE